MRVVLADPRCTLIHGDSAQLGDMLDENSVDSIVTDPPAGISFMGKDWDGDKGGRDAWIDWLAGLLRPALRALKPGGHALVWALPRTSHWTAMALEVAGFEIRDVHHHLFGTGFPKSLTSKSAPIPDGAGTALKPAVEHWILARKSLAGTVGANFAEHGTGVLQIDVCRVGTNGEPIPTSTHAASDSIGTFKTGVRVVEAHALGRWPAHLSLEHAEDCTAECVDGCPVRVLDEQSLSGGMHGAGSARVGSAEPRRQRKAMRDQVPSNRSTGDMRRLGDSGGASRFFYVAKGSRSEKDAGLDHLPPRTGGEATGRDDDTAGVNNPRAGAGRTGGARNFHPTVKSIALMRWLVRLVTPPGGVVLDMFAGSGTTGCAALAEGMRFIGCEMSEEYIPIAVGRLRHALGSAEPEQLDLGITAGAQQ